MTSLYGSRDLLDCTLTDLEFVTLDGGHARGLALALLSIPLIREA